MGHQPTFRHAADQGIVVEFGSEIDVEANQKVIAMDATLAEAEVSGVVETIPTYRSLFVRYDPLVLDAVTLIETLRVLCGKCADNSTVNHIWKVPAFYGGNAGMDLDALAAMKDLTTQEIVTLHSSTTFRVFMVGFMPGFVYLGGLPKQLNISRLTQPRMAVPAGALGIGGQQACINSIDSPSGWRFIGRTPLRIFDIRRDPPFLIQAGDLIKFEPVSEATVERFDNISKAGGIPADRQVIT